jgi:hypothetical protein
MPLRVDKINKRDFEDWQTSFIVPEEKLPEV